MKYVCASIYILILSSCVSTQIRPLTEINEIYPDGKYIQEISVDVEVQKNHFEFNCGVLKSKSEFQMTGFNGFGLTLFKVREDSNHHLDFESSLSEIEKNREFFLKVYTMVKEIFYLKHTDHFEKFRSTNDLKNGQDSKFSTTQDGSKLNYRKILKTRFQNEDIESVLVLSEFDKNRIPLNTHLSSSPFYKVSAKTLRYEFRKDTDLH